MKICSRCNDRIILCKGFCNRCYYATKKGSKTRFERIKETNFIKNGNFFLGGKFVVDEDVFHKFKNLQWWDNGSGYAKQRSLGYLHRVVCPNYKIVDHINRNTFDNRRDNLRDGSYGVNQLNSNKKPISTSGYRGVYKMRGKWQARIIYKGNRCYIGTFLDPREAAIALFEFAKTIGRSEFYSVV